MTNEERLSLQLRISNTYAKMTATEILDSLWGFLRLPGTYLQPAARQKVLKHEGEWSRQAWLAFIKSDLALDMPTYEYADIIGYAQRQGESDLALGRRYANYLEATQRVATPTLIWLAAFAVGIWVLARSKN